MTKSYLSLLFLAMLLPCFGIDLSGLQSLDGQQRSKLEGLMNAKADLSNSSQTMTVGSISIGGASPSTVAVTNVLCDFPSILAFAGSDLTFPINGAVTNMAVTLGKPPTESLSLGTTAFVASNGFVTIRAQAIVTVDQGSLPYRIIVHTTPLQ